ncbi:MAG: MFS transporter [Oscillospiraceae bacterium]|nr:MFS transporter [Oscillospiraceae bacterium]
MVISKNAKKAIMLGTLCSVSYLAVYIARNILSAVTPQMVEAGFSEAYIGSVSSIYLIMYACGQMINGLIGDKIKAKWMIGFGLLGAGVTNFIFSRIVLMPTMALVVYGITGFFLSMIYGPMTKVVSENTELIYATRCSLGYTFASFFGSPAAGLLATFLAWDSVFSVGSGFLVVMALLVMLVFTAFEKRGIVKYGQYQKQEKGLKNIKVLLKHQIVKYSLVSILTGVVRTSVVFWLPTYIAQHLNFASEKATMLFSVATFIISFTTFIAVFIYEKLGHDMDKTVLIMFCSSAVFFLLTYFVHLTALNLVFIVLAIMGSNGAATMLWSRYCPSLRDTGMVSSATGFLDCLSYAAAALANLIFANAAPAIGWGNLILVWFGIVLVGVVIALPYKKMKKAE